MSENAELAIAQEEFELLRREFNSERKASILYGVGLNPKKLDPDLLDFSVETLGTLLGYEFDELARDVVRWQNDTIRDAGFYRDKKGTQRGITNDDLILAYRGGGKSTWGTIIRAIWYAVRDPDIRMGFVSEAEDLPKAFLVEIEGHLIGNRDLVQMFGTFKPSAGPAGIGEAKRKTIRQRRKRYQKEPTFHAFGVGGQSAGYHYEVLFADDLVTFKGSRTKTVRQNLSDWYDSTFGGLGMRWTINHHIGTPYFPGDLYDRLENGRDGEKTGPLQGSTLSIPAEYPKKTAKMVFGKLREILHRIANSPSRLPLEALDRIKAKIGRIHYGTQYLMDRSLMVGEIFNLGDFGQYDPDAPGLDEFRKGWARYCYFDLKATQKDVGDYFVGIVIAVAPDKSRVDVVDMVRKRAGMSWQRKAIINLTRKHRATLAGIEAVQMQTAFAEEIVDMELIPAEPVPVEADKIARAMSISPQVEAGKVHLPFEDSPLGVRMRSLFEELVSFPDGDHDDCVDAFVGAMKLAYYGGAPAAAGGASEAETKKAASRLRNKNRKLRATYS